MTIEICNQTIKLVLSDKDVKVGLMNIIKYPRTKHICGSRIQKGDEDLEVVHIENIKDSYLVIEEKMDGSNSGISFDSDGKLYIQCRGHFLTGGPGEKQFSLLKQWANIHYQLLFNVLKDRYTMYGEWLYAKHTVYYDSLPDYFMEFDILDRQNNRWLSTKRRNELLKMLRPTVKSVRVIMECSGSDLTTDILNNLVVESPFISKRNTSSLVNCCINKGLDEVKTLKETDTTRLMEGLYIKSETNDDVVGRYKWVRKSFLDVLAGSDSHWKSRPIIPNLLMEK